MDKKLIHDILEKQLLANNDKLIEIQTKHYLDYQAEAQKYVKEHADESQESVCKHIAEMQVRTIAQACLDTFSLGIQVGIHAVMDLGETILNGGISGCKN